MAKKIPEDVKQVCLWLVRGHERRLQEEKTKRGEGKKERTRKRERERIEAVNLAIESVGKDIEAEEVRERLKEAVKMNVRNGREYPYEILGIDAISRADFYRRKERLLIDIAERLGLM